MIFIVNPISGKGRKERIVDFLKKEGCKVVFTEYAGHAEEIARHAEDDVIVAVGGDGTVNEVARGIIGTDKALGIIPCGSGDGLALHLGISRHYKTALKTIEQGHRQLIDSAIINGRPFFSVCGIGFDAVVSERFAKSGKRGLLNYIEQGLRTWKEYTPEKYLINIDGKEWENDAALITIGNSSQWGNNAKITPLADISDGILDITLVDMFNTLEMPALGYLLMTGRLDRNHNIHCYRGKHITITRKVSGPAHADGDWFNTGTEIDITILPKSLNVIIP
ncbi:MAG: diacylglycerol kinase family lipid kinase [Bacteroidales bacterium]|nr:diacylglycerol kinase family lipid kinase [Bacteroidales bacterium]